MSKLYIHIGVLSITCTAFFSKSCMVFSFFAFNLYALVRTAPILCIFFEHSCTIVHNLTKSGKTVLFLYINNKKLCNLTFRQTQSFFYFQYVQVRTCILLSWYLPYFTRHNTSVYDKIRRDIIPKLHPETFRLHPHIHLDLPDRLLHVLPL